MNDEIERQIKIRIYTRLGRRYGEKALIRRIRLGWLVRAIARRVTRGRACATGV